MIFTATRFFSQFAPSGFDPPSFGLWAQRASPAPRSIKIISPSLPHKGVEPLTLGLKVPQSTD